VFLPRESKKYEEWAPTSRYFTDRLITREKGYCFSAS